MALAAKIPFRHPYAAGFPGLGSQPMPTDADALDYLDRVAAADGASVEVGVATAVSAFFRDTKAAGVFSALKACCILAGARTLAGALVPVVGDAPTNVANGFVSGDFSRTSGLKGDGTSYLDSGRAAGPQDNEHLAIYQTSLTTAASKAIAGTGLSQNGVSYFFNISTTNIGFRSQTISFDTITNGNAVGLVGMSRSSSAGYSARANGESQDFTQASQTLFSANHAIFTATTNTSLTDATIAFYSIGTSLSLEALDTAVTNLIARLKFALLVGENPSGLDPDTIDYVVRGYEAGGTLE